MYFETEGDQTFSLEVSRFVLKNTCKQIVKTKNELRAISELAQLRASIVGQADFLAMALCGDEMRAIMTGVPDLIEETQDLMDRLDSLKKLQQELIAKVIVEFKKLHH